MTMQSLARQSLRGLNAAGGWLSRPRKPRYLYLTAFLIPVILVGIMWAVSGVIPFGKKMILAHDQWHQYYPFFLDLRSRLQNGNSLFHSWTTGMGTSYLPLFAYYLASPLNLLAVILPEGLLMPYYTLTVLVRLGLAGLSCCYFLKKTFGREELTLTVFSTAYAMSAFLMGYYWNAMWLDTVALLPLVALGTFSLLRDRRYVLYVASLSLSVFCNYYVGFFTCVFVLLLFIGYHVVNWDDLAGLGTRLVRIAFFTLVALGMTALLTVPTLLGMSATSSTQNNKMPPANAMNIVVIPASSKQELLTELTDSDLGELYAFFGRKAPEAGAEETVSASWIGGHEALLTLRLGYVKSFLAAFRVPLDGLRRVLSNAGTLTVPTSMEGLPNIFCGFSTLLLAIAYLFCRRIPRRERFFSVLLLLFFGVSFLFRTLDYLWHGMHFPNMLPHRFSFLWCFVVIFMGFRAYTQAEHLSRWRAVALILPAALAVYCVISNADHFRVKLATVLVALFTLGLLLLYSFRAIRRELVTLGLCVCVLAEALGCGISGVRQIGVTDSSYYPTKKEDTAAVLRAMKEREADTVDLWRAEVALKQTLNDSTLNGYNGITVFSSAANARVSKFLQSLGLAASVAGNRYAYQEADPFTNLLLGLKYLIDRNDRNLNPDYFRQVAKEGEVRLLENQAYLSLGFMVSDNALDYAPDTAEVLPFERLNRLFRAMTGIDEDLYEAFPVNDFQAVGTVEITERISNGMRITGEGDDENYAEITVTVPKDGLLCLYTKSSAVSDPAVYLHGEKQYSYADAYGYNRFMGRFSAGEKVVLRYKPKSADKNGYVNVGGAMFNAELFDAARAVLAENSMVPTLVNDTQVEGAVRVRTPGLLYLSIPDDPGWSLQVDGEEARITPVGDAMIAVHLEPGLHAIALSFEAPGFSLGLKISIVCLAIFLALVILALLARFSRPPIVKVPVRLADPRRRSAPEDPEDPEPQAPRPGSTMPRLDMTQAWNKGELPADAADELYGYEAPVPSAPADTGVFNPALLDEDGKFDPTLLDAILKEPPAREDTGVFAPVRKKADGAPQPRGAVYTPDENGEAGPASFDTLAHLERLDALLAELDSEQNDGKK